VVTRTWTATDACGNHSSQSQVVTVQDTTPPVIICPPNVAVNSDPGHCYASDVELGTPVTSDNCGGPVGAVNDAPAQFMPGTTVITWTATDACGNTASCQQLVVVTAEADLSVAIAASANPAPLGTNLTYTVTVSNGGPCTATGIVLSSLLSGGQLALAVTNNGLGQGCPFPGPVAWWPAEGNANDVVGGNNGALAGGVTYVAGEVGQAFQFDGLSGSVTVPDAPSLRPAALTIEGWMKIQDVAGVHVIIGKRLGASTADSYSIWIGSGVLFAAMADNAGSGPFLSYPEFPSSSLFTAADIVDLQSFALTLKAQSAPILVSQFIYNNLSAPTLALLTAYVSGPDPALRSALVGDLNIIIQSGNIYNPVRFAGVTLSAESTYILNRNPSGSDLVRLNRFLIRDAYPADFATDVFPQLDQQFHVAYTFDPVAQVQALYVNGQLVNASLVTKTIAYDAHPVLIGADDNGGVPGYFYQGDIDEMALYNRALTGTEVRAIFNAGAGGKCQTPGLVPVADLASGATAQVSLVAVPINCANAAASATVTSSTADPNLANNVAAISVPVLDLPPGQLLLSLQRVSKNNNLLRVSWPLTCTPSVLLGTPSLNLPMTWSPVAAPVIMMDDRNYTIIPADQTMRYFRVKLP
jgi:uncharacterized repeat protein (TIGR01451 family)